MRRAWGLSLATGGLFAAVVVAQPAPVPPGKLPVPAPVPAPSGLGAGDPAKLKADIEALSKERTEASKLIPGGAKTSAERDLLQKQLLEILKRIADRPPPAAYPKAPPLTTKEGKGFEPGEPTKAVDLVRTAENLYRLGDTDAALKTFRLIDRSLLSREDRAFVNYMTGCALRKTGRRSEAAVIFREVAEARDDDFLSECAISQLALIRSTQELEAQLEQLRSRAKSR